MHHYITNIRELIDPDTLIIDVDKLQQIISDDDNDEITIEFSNNSLIPSASTITYFWPAYRGEPFSCRQRMDASESDEDRLELDIASKTVTFKLHGNTIKFFQGTFDFCIAGGKLEFDLEGGIIHCGLEKTQVLEWVDINDHSTPIKVEDVSIYNVGDNLQCSFIGTNGSTSHGKCYIEEVNELTNTIEKWEYISPKGTDKAEPKHAIIPQGAYISNKCFFSHSVTLTGHGEIEVKNGSIIESCGYYLTFANNNVTVLQVKIDNIDFNGQFLDGLAFTGGKKVDNEEQNGNINAKITKCTFGKSYDIAKQGIMIINKGTIEIDRCRFVRSNHDPDITVFECPFPFNGNVIVKNSYFNGRNSDFDDLRESLGKPFESGSALVPGQSKILPLKFDGEEFVHAPGPVRPHGVRIDGYKDIEIPQPIHPLSLKFEGYEYINDNCLSVIQTHSINSIRIEKCLFENYERQLILSQAHILPMTIRNVHVEKSIFASGHPYFFEIGLVSANSTNPEPPATNATQKELDDYRAQTARYNAKVDSAVEAEVGSVLFRDCYFEDVDPYCWPSRVEWNPGFNTELSAARAKAVIENMESISQKITHNKCRFELYRSSGAGIDYTRVLKNPNFNDITIINDTPNTPLDLGHRAFNYESPVQDGLMIDVTPKPSYSGYVNILSGRVRIGNGAEKRNPDDLTIQHFGAEPFSIPANWRNTVFNKLRAQYLWLAFYRFKKAVLRYTINNHTSSLEGRATIRALQYDKVP